MREKVTAYILLTLSFLYAIILVVALPINLINFYEKYSFYNDYLPSVYQKIVSYDASYGDKVSEGDFIDLMNSVGGEYEVKEIIKKYDSGFYLKSNKYLFDSSYSSNIFRSIFVSFQLIFSFLLIYYSFRTTIKPSNKIAKELNAQIELIKRQIENSKLSGKLKQ